jgi:hypothetical protein
MRQPYSSPHCLGHGLIMAQPELGGGEFEHGEEVCGALFVAGGEASEVFDAIEEPLDAIARPLEHRAEAELPATMHHWWNIGRGTGGFDLAAGAGSFSVKPVMRHSAAASR